METKTYNGWTNYETWLAGMYFDGNYTGPETYEEIRRGVRRLAHKGPYAVGQYLKEEIEGCIPDMGASLAADFLNAALSEINFHELASHYLEEIEEDDESEMASGLNIKAISDDLERADIVETANGPCQSVFLGTVQALMPSGKVAAPWADHRTEEESAADSNWLALAESELAAIGACLETGEGDGCDLFAVKYVSH